VDVESKLKDLDFKTDFDFKKIEMLKLKYELSDLDPTLLTCWLHGHIQIQEQWCVMYQYTTCIQSGTPYPYERKKKNACKN